MKIVQTPNIEANQMLFGEDEENRLDDGEGDEDDDEDDDDDDDEDESEEESD